VDSGRRLLRIGLLTTGVMVLLILVLQAGPAPATQATAEAVRPTSTPEPLVPTRTPTPVMRAGTTEPAGTVPTLPRATAASAGSVSTTTDDWRGVPRWGAGVAQGSILDYDIDPLRLGWYVDWRTRADPPQLEGIEYVQMIRLRAGVLNPEADVVTSVAQAVPGLLWLVGNEPDVKWQDNVEPAAYARLYHEAYTAIKEGDPTAQVALGGVAQPTPLRLRYLEEILEAYQDAFGEEMPMDFWNVHNFVLREERGSWGVDIPPGLADDYGELYEIDDCGDLEIFKEQIVAFRQWMADHGYRDYALVVSEYGIPMPEDYGFPPETTVAFLTGTFEFFLTARDPVLGYPEDDHRLVQRWCWYSLSAPDSYYPNGRLFDPDTYEMTAIGAGWAEYVRDRIVEE